MYLGILMELETNKMAIKVYISEDKAVIDKASGTHLATKANVD